MTLFTEEKKAVYFKKIADAVNIESLEDIFDLIHEVAKKGEYQLDTKKDLSEAELSMLEDLDFEVDEYYEGDEEYDRGFRYYILWEDVEEGEEN